MKRSGEVIDLVVPWAGLATGVLAAGIDHQFGSEGMFDHCASISPIPILLVSVLALAVMFAGTFLSWRVFRNRAEAPARKVVAAVSVGSSALFALAIVLPMIAALMLPPCFQ
jgi:hypothetical protein